jgi:guanylate kinase
VTGDARLREDASAQRGVAERRTPRAGIPFVVAAPSGTGKTTVCRRVVERDPQVEFSVSHTTRASRPGEVDGVAYHFVTPARFRELVAGQAFLEWAVYHGHHYGTSWAALEGPLSKGRDVLLEIEIQGARQVRARRSDARLIFLLPPSLEVLERRLRSRQTESEQDVAARLDLARREIAQADGCFDYAVVNDDLERCVAQVLEILAAERAGGAQELRRRFEPARALSGLGPGALPHGPDRVG